MTVKIKLQQSLAGVEVLPAGLTIETSPEEAARMVEAGIAIYVETEETAMSKQAPKRRTAARRTGKKRKK